MNTTSSASSGHVTGMIPCRSTKITVTAEDIAKGCLGSAWNCPIARAIQRRLRGGYFAHAGQTTYAVRQRFIHVAGTALIFRGPMPFEASEFVRAFDASKPVEPFEFEIDLPEESLC